MINMEAQKSFRFSFQFYHLLLILLLQSILSNSVLAIPHKIPRLTPHRETLTRRDPNKILSASAISDDFITLFYTQTIDHFNYGPQSYATFQQRYVINFKYWGGSNSPIFAYLGAEEQIDFDLQSIGFLSANARHFSALQVYIEHRYYGESIPFGTMEQAMNDISTRGYFNSAQAIADYAEVPLHSPQELKGYLESIYTAAAQYNAPPEYPVSMICSAIDGEPTGTDILGRIFAGVNSYKKSYPCYHINDYSYQSESSLGWTWQTCSEMVMPIGRSINTMFQPSHFNLDRFIQQCERTYGVTPRPHWVTTYYGGHDIKLILRRFASNIIFSNGLKDPYSSGGVLEDISESVLAVSTVNGSHCLDIHLPAQSDPSWLVEQRNKEVEIIDGWITKYYADLLVLKK
ncbi:Serine carboxypeptidase S28 family protein [Forsythia ovata]|uniref:Serine carboxypeptidase S28 family protein n=1 Tax=Forsythia ovata TaxID=205694 RepID=A0ABD1T2T4_9LAMI